MFLRFTSCALNGPPLGTGSKSTKKKLLFNENEKIPFHIAPKYLCMKISFGHSAVWRVFLFLSSRSILPFFGYRKSNIPGVSELFGAWVHNLNSFAGLETVKSYVYLRSFFPVSILLFRVHVKNAVVSRRTLGKLLVWSWSAEQVSSTWAGQCRACYIASQTYV